MNANQIESKFAEMGARFRMRAVSDRLNTWGSAAADYAVDIQRDRKGEFFELRIPAHLRDELEVSVMQSEPKQRHLLLFVRKPGDTPQLDHVCSRHPNGILPKDYRELLRANPKAAHWGWRVMRRNPGVYARGSVRHSDHATIDLPFWHRVLMNTEAQSRTMANVAFLD